MLDRRAFLAGVAITSAGLASRQLAQAAGTDTGGADSEIPAFIHELPKAELHIHLEGSLEPEMRFELARRNGIALPYPDVEALRRSYRFHDLQSFLAVYYQGRSVLVREQDFYDLCYAYLARAASQNVLYSEMFFDPQQHVQRGIPLSTVIRGFTAARQDAQRKSGIESQLIMCFMRELSAESAMQILDAALSLGSFLAGVGLDSDENGNPPDKFRAVFAKAKANGLRVTVHCDVNQPDTHEHIRQALQDVRADRIDHGGNILERPELMAIARQAGLAFTVCPLYSGWLTGPRGQRINIVRSMLDQGLKVTVNSDDPAYMGGHYISDSLRQAQIDSGLNRAELVTISRNAFEAAWITQTQRSRYLSRLDSFAHQWRTSNQSASRPHR